MGNPILTGSRPYYTEKYIQTENPREIRTDHQKATTRKNGTAGNGTEMAAVKTAPIKPGLDQAPQQSREQYSMHVQHVSSKKTKSGITQKTIRNVPIGIDRKRK